jgi:hypothetical protein
LPLGKPDAQARERNKPDAQARERNKPDAQARERKQEGTVADRSSQLVLSALSRAAAEDGLPLYASKSSSGLFPSTALGRQAAQRCCDEGYLQATAAAAPTGRSSTPLCTLTQRGRDFLLSQVSPRQVLEDIVRVLEAREAQVGQLQGQVRQLQSSLESLRAGIAPVLEQVRQAEAPRNLNGLCREFRHEEAAPAPSDPVPAILQSLTRWAQSGAPEDCPLPELFRQVQARCPGLSLGVFHDALRRQQDAGRIYLHPWTGPLYAIPEPPCALLVGHEVSYYASLRPDAG